MKKVCTSLESLVKPAAPFRKGRNHPGGSASNICAKIPEQRIKEEHPCAKPADAARNKDSGEGTINRGEEILSPFFFPGLSRAGLPSLESLSPLPGLAPPPIPPTPPLIFQSN